jgi:hypothetical protein
LITASGEKLEQRDANQTFTVVQNQLDELEAVRHR